MQVCAGTILCTFPNWRTSAIVALAAALTFAAPGAGAAWFGVCDEAVVPPSAWVFSNLLRPGGGSNVFLVADRPPVDCSGINLAVEPARVTWARILTRVQAARLVGGVILKGTEDGSGFAVNETIPLVETAAPRQVLPVGDELLPELHATAFGDASRANVRAVEGRVDLDCRPGKSAAGAVLAARHARLPAGAFLALEVGFSARGEFTISGSAIGEARSLGVFSGQPGNARFDLAPALDGELPASWVFVCPTHGADLDIRSVRLQPGAGRSAVAARALWVWRPKAWQSRPDELLRLLADNAADTVFVTVPLTTDRSRVAAPGVLEGFVRRATARGVRVWAVAGDAHAVRPAERVAYVERARAYADYNRSVPAAARLAGLQLDIEPYLNAGYHIDAEGWLSAYLETLAQVKPAAAMPLDVTIPFWWGSQQFRGGSFLDHLAPHVDVVTVMNYRTDRAQILDFAEPFLAWAGRSRRSVRIGLETGPIPDEWLRIYRPRDAGELWLVALQEKSLLLLLDAPAPNPAGAAFAYSHTTRWRGSSITFRHDVGALRDMLPGLEQVWRAWPAFAGVALHGLDAD